MEKKNRALAPLLQMHASSKELVPSPSQCMAKSLLWGFPGDLGAQPVSALPCKGVGKTTQPAVSLDPGCGHLDVLEACPIPGTPPGSLWSPPALPQVWPCPCFQLRGGSQHTQGLGFSTDSSTLPGLEARVPLPRGSQGTRGQRDAILPRGCTHRAPPRAGVNGDVSTQRRWQDALHLQQPLGLYNSPNSFPFAILLQFPHTRK